MTQSWRALILPMRSGHEREYFVIESVDWVNVIALTKDEQVVLIEQFRHGIGEAALEIPDLISAGRISHALVVAAFHHLGLDAGGSR